jgi:hypothetical protein
MMNEPNNEMFNPLRGCYKTLSFFAPNRIGGYSYSSPIGLLRIKLTLPVGLIPKGYHMNNLQCNWRTQMPMIIPIRMIDLSRPQ